MHGNFLDSPAGLAHRWHPGHNDGLELEGIYMRSLALRPLGWVDHPPDDRICLLDACLEFNAPVYPLLAHLKTHLGNLPRRGCSEDFLVKFEVCHVDDESVPRQSLHKILSNNPT